jgi:hypothetical protein
MFVKVRVTTPNYINGKDIQSYELWGILLNSMVLISEGDTWTSILKTECEVLKTVDPRTLEDDQAAKAGSLLAILGAKPQSVSITF